MKLYTEEEILNYLTYHSSAITRYDLKNIPHIELPSDKEINNQKNNNMTKETLQETALSFLPHSEVEHDTDFIIGFEFGAKWQDERMSGEIMRSYIEEKWKQYRIVTNEEDAWLFKEWLIKQTYGGNK